MVTNPRMEIRERNDEYQLEELSTDIFIQARAYPNTCKKGNCFRSRNLRKERGFQTYLLLNFCQILNKRVAQPRNNPDLSPTVSCIIKMEPFLALDRHTGRERSLIYGHRIHFYLIFLEHKTIAILNILKTGSIVN